MASAIGALFCLDEELSEAEVAHFKEISVPGYQRIGAPQVGRDSAANQWILDARKANTPEEVAARNGSSRTSFVSGPSGLRRS